MDGSQQRVLQPVAFVSKLIVAPDVRRWLFAVFLVLGIAIEVYFVGRCYGYRALKSLFYGVGMLAVAYVVWLLDNFGVLCRPESLLQGHAVWHALGALALYILFLHYLSIAKLGDLKSPSA